MAILGKFVPDWWPLLVGTTLLSSIIVSAITVLFNRYFLLKATEKLKLDYQKQHSEFIEQYKWNIKVREQAVKTAEYMALARDLKETDNDELYRKANQLSWELAMLLPEDVYRHVMQAIASQSNASNVLTATVEIRKILLGSEAGNLSSNDIGLHARGIGRPPTSN